MSMAAFGEGISFAEEFHHENTKGRKHEKERGLLSCFHTFVMGFIVQGSPALRRFAINRYGVMRRDKNPRAPGPPVGGRGMKHTNRRRRPKGCRTKGTGNGIS